MNRETISHLRIVHAHARGTFSAPEQTACGAAVPLMDPFVVSVMRPRREGRAESSESVGWWDGTAFCAECVRIAGRP